MPVPDLKPRQKWALLAGVVLLYSLGIGYSANGNSRKAKAELAAETARHESTAKKLLEMKAAHKSMAKRFPMGNPRVPIAPTSRLRAITLQ